jgi:hypothetical protein
MSKIDSYILIGAVVVGVIVLYEIGQSVNSGTQNSNQTADSVNTALAPLIYLENGAGELWDDSAGAVGSFFDAITDNAEQGGEL